MTLTMARSAACTAASSAPDLPVLVGMKTLVASVFGDVSASVAIRVVAEGSLMSRRRRGPGVSGKHAVMTLRASSRSMSPASATDIRPGTTMDFCRSVSAAISGDARRDGSPVDAAYAGPADAERRTSRMFRWLSSRRSATSVRNGTFSAASSAATSAGRSIRSVIRTTASRQLAFGAVNETMIASRLVAALTTAPMSSRRRSISPDSRPDVERNHACSSIWVSARWPAG